MKRVLANTAEENNNIQKKKNNEKKKVAIVTGSSEGIGRSITIAVANSGEYS